MCIGCGLVIVIRRCTQITFPKLGLQVNDEIENKPGGKYPLTWELTVFVSHALLSSSYAGPATPHAPYGVKTARAAVWWLNLGPPLCCVSSAACLVATWGPHDGRMLVGAVTVM